VRPSVFLTIGTAGSVFGDFGLGDVVITRAAKFRLQDEFRNEPFNGQTYRSDWALPTSVLDNAQDLMKRFAAELAESPFGPPHPGFASPGPLIEAPPNDPDIKLELDARDMPEFHPILTPITSSTAPRPTDSIGRCRGGDRRRRTRLGLRRTHRSTPLGRGPQHVRSGHQR
jgi:hypothetical protein